MPIPTDRSELSTGHSAKVMNEEWITPPRWSAHKANMEELYPDILKYYEDQRMGKIEGESFEEGGDPVCEEEVKESEKMATRKVLHTFFAMDYSHGFTGRGGRSTSCAHDWGRQTYGVAVLSEVLERPCLVGPRNETLEENVDPFRDLTHEATDRPLWRASDEASDEESVCPLGELREDEDEDLGPLGESRDEEEVGPFGGSRDENQDGLRQRDEEEEEDETVSISEEDMNKLMRLAATSVALISKAPANTGAASSPQTTTTLPTEPQAPLTSSTPSLASTPSTPSRKRASDSEDNAEDEESPSQRKRRRMDDVLGIIENDDNAAKSHEIDSVATTPDTKMPRKRTRFPDDELEDDMTKPTRKRLRLYMQTKEIRDVQEEYVTAHQAEVAKYDDLTPVYQNTPSSEAQEATTVDKAPLNTKTNKQPSVEDEVFTNDEAEEREDVPAYDNAAPADTEWDTAHGINSNCANIPIPEKRVWDVTGESKALYLPASTDSPDRSWTESEKEDLRVYIQDYGIEDWTLLSQSTNRPEKELQGMYFEIVTARNKQAGRYDYAGIPEAFFDLAPPSGPEEPRKLRSPGQKGRSKKINLGDLKHDLKATSFPKVTRDGGMVDAKGNVLLGIMGDICCITKRRQPKPEQEDSESLPSAEDPRNSAPCEAEDGGSEFEIEKRGPAEQDYCHQQMPASSPRETGPVSKRKGPWNVVQNGGVKKSSCGLSHEVGHQMELLDMKEAQSIEQDPTREQAPSPSPVGKRKDPLNDATMEGEAKQPNSKQEDPAQEQQAPIPTASEAKTNTGKGALGPNFAGVSKLSGSSRLGVPRNAAGLRNYSAE
ncbi:MAG: hypothetical protein ALECFALPRED_008704 [Alectoria fallacina]|uniref:Myb-like domain-containing protein n=1 Tax=Alectoria fallacina TaxID=1903189 RepID=A0A8H3J4P3_9LECA|nr:MAG: hypothetical protein ALECFALPRED_008704 [Alectoria fallacina]